MVYKSITGKAPEYISSMLTYVSEHHKRQTRSTGLDLLHIPRSHSAYFDRAFSVQGPKLWNSFPADIRNSTSINRFKSELKRFFFFFFFALQYLKCARNAVVQVTVRLQLSDAGAEVVFGRKLDRPWLSPSGTAEGHCRVH